MDEYFEKELAQAIRPMGLILYSVDRKPGLLRIAVDRPGGVDIDHLENASRVLSALLDSRDSVPGGQYVLEVSSPGAERDIRSAQQAACAVGLLVSIKFRKASNERPEQSHRNRSREGAKVLGRLQAVDGERLLIQLTQHDATFDMDENGCAWVALGDDVAVRTVLEWNGSPEASGKQVRGGSMSMNGRVPGASGLGSKVGRSKTSQREQMEKVKG
ncbi:MAG: hypothetical protein ACYDGY_07500 [Acidimicrobiales bacterium]